MTHPKRRTRPQPADPPTPTRPSAAARRVLIVDADRVTADFAADITAAGLDCRLMIASSLLEARRILACESFCVLLTDLRLPDGRGLSLIPELRRHSPGASVLVTGKSVKLDDALDAIRCGAGDILPKPFTHDLLRERLARAFSAQDAIAHDHRRMARLRSAVRRLSEARRTVSRKVDLLCNDLVGAYSELSRQVDAVRTTEDFRKLCGDARDLEQLLCHAMDWIMRRVGFANIAVFLATDDTFQLGAYVKYTLGSSPELASALRDGIVVRAAREWFVRLTGEEAARQLSAAELRHLRGQAIVAANCTYLGESLATVVVFREQDPPFSAEDAELFRAIAPIFAIALAGQARSEPPADGEGGSWGGQQPEDDGYPPPPKSRREPPDADWWKRGESPPF